MANNDLEFLDQLEQSEYEDLTSDQYEEIDFNDVRVIDPTRDSTLAMRRGKEPLKFGWKLRPIVLCGLAISSAITGLVLNRPPKDEGLPQMVHGTWHTLEDKYAGQGFTLSNTSLTFHLGPDYQVVQAISRVDRRQKDGFEYYDLYAGPEDQWPTFSLLQWGEFLVLPNQREIRWRKGDIPDADGVVPTEYFIAGYAPERSDSIVATTRDRLMEICMVEVTKIQRDVPVSCVEWLGLNEGDSISADELQTRIEEGANSETNIAPTDGTISNN